MLTDKQDYDEIYQKYKNLVMKAAYKYSGNYDIAEDITQSTFLQLYMYIDELKDINIKAWMYTTAKHMALNYNKKAEREVLSETGDEPEYGQAFSAGIHPWYIPAHPEETLKELDRLAAYPFCKAIGEAGLDKFEIGRASCRERVSCYV